MSTRQRTRPAAAQGRTRAEENSNQNQFGTVGKLIEKSLRLPRNAMPSEKPRGPTAPVVPHSAPQSTEKDAVSRDAIRQTVSRMDQLQTDLQTVCDEIIETRCALEEIEEKNEHLTLRNSELEQMISRLKSEMLEKSHRVEDLQAGFEKRQFERNKYWSSEVDKLEAKLKLKTSQ